MATTLAVLHIVVCVFLILLIMIQDPKGGGSGLFSGGGSNSILGSSGGADFLTKATRYMAVAFGVLCIALTIFSKPSKTGVFSDVTTAPIEAVKPAPTEAPMDAAKPSEPAATAPAPTAPSKPESK
ncbi:preprotein translocase subunit SecG [bacterium]|nr:preprotein translocase subunit SecG [bacterium]